MMMMMMMMMIVWVQIIQSLTLFHDNDQTSFVGSRTETP